MIDDLKSCFLFADLESTQLQRIAKSAARVHLEEGGALFQQGDPAKRFYLATRGQIKLFRLSPAGNEKVIDIVTPGNTFGEALMFLERPRYPVGAEALQDSEVISIDALDFTDMLRNSIDTCFVMLGSMSQRLRARLREIDDLSLHSATCRVAAYMARRVPAESDSFELPVAKQIVASRLSVKPETFSRIIKSLSKSGVIQVAGNKITVHDREALNATAEYCNSSLDTF